LLFIFLEMFGRRQLLIALDDVQIIFFVLNIFSHISELVTTIRKIVARWADDLLLQNQVTENDKQHPSYDLFQTNIGPRMRSGAQLEPADHGCDGGRQNVERCHGF